MKSEYMRRFFKELLFAFGFLTIIPGLGKIEVEPEGIGRSTVFYPLVGFTIGLLASLNYLLRGLSPITISVLICVSILVFTRGIHADGLIDTFDGFLSGKRQKEEILSIMRDSHLGALGFISAFSLYLLKICFILEILAHIPIRVPILFSFTISFSFPITFSFPLTLSLALALSRGGVSVVSFLFPYAGGKNGLGKSFVSSVGLKQALLSFLIMEILSFRRDCLLFLLLPPIVTVFWIFWGFICKWKIGGITGDTIGAGIELSEVFCLMLILIFLFLY